MINYPKSLYKILNHPSNRDHKLKTLTRLFWWKLNQLFFHFPSVVDLTEGIKCICYPCSSFGSLVVYTKLPEYAEMNFLLDVLKSGDTFVDVGANIGAYSLLAASKIKSGKIYAFEPSVQVLSCLEENIRLNNLANIFVIDKVVSDVNGYEPFIFGKHCETDHISTNKASRVAKLLPSITLDNFFDNQKITKLDLLKIDVEGAELKVLRGLRRHLENGKVKLILFEVNNRSRDFGSTALDLIAYLKSFNYSVYVFGRDYKLRRIKKNDVETFSTFDALAVNDSKLSRELIRKFLKS